MDIEVRPARAEDSRAITDLINDAYSVEAFFVEGPRVAQAEIERQIEEGLFFKAEGTHRRLLGCVLYRDSDPPAREAYFGLLAIAPAAQGRGLGRRLVRFVEDRAASRGVSRITLRVVDLRRELPPWYEKQGYRVVGSEPFSDPARQKRPCRFLLLAKEIELGGAS